MKRRQYLGLVIICIINIILLYTTFKGSIKSIDFVTLTGERIEVVLLTGNNKELQVKDNGFAVYTDSVEIIEGAFISINEFKSFKELISNEDDTERLDLNIIENNNTEILYWTYIASADDNSMSPDVTYVKMLTDKTAVICHSSMPLEDAKNTISCLGFVPVENIDIEQPAVNYQ